WWATLSLIVLVGAALGWAFARLNLLHGLLAVGHHFAWKALAVAALGTGRVHFVAMLLMAALADAATFAPRWRTLRRMMGVVKSESVGRALEADPHRL